MSFFSRRHWAIHNPLKSWTLSGLTLHECQLLVASMSDAETKISWVYHKTWSDWKPLGDDHCHDLLKLQDKELFKLPELPTMSGDDRDHDITQVRSSLHSQAKFNDPLPRKFVRFEARVPVEIHVGPHSFKTFTADISEGGFLFEDPLPEWVAGYFTVAIHSDADKFELTCFLAEDQKKEKFRIEIAPSNGDLLLKNFCRWLTAQKFPEISKLKA